jgi:hypothetical protein
VIEVDCHLDVSLNSVAGCNVVEPYRETINFRLGSWCGKRGSKLALFSCTNGVPPFLPEGFAGERSSLICVPSNDGGQLPLYDGSH